MIAITTVQTKRERDIFIAFPWPIYKHDPLWEQVCRRNPGFRVCGANIHDMEGEVSRILFLQNEGLRHIPEHVPHTRKDIEAMILLFDEMAKRAAARGYKWADL